MDAINCHKDFIGSLNFDNWLIMQNHYPQGYGWLHTDKTLNNAFCLAGHEITDMGPICVPGDKCNKKEVENKVREMILVDDTGSDILNEKLRRYINRTGIAYKIVSVDINHKLFSD